MRISIRGERGTAMVEFALVSVPVILFLLTIVQLSLSMWTYHTMAFAIREGLRYASTKGPGCSYPGNSCGTTVGVIAQKIAGAGIGLRTDQLKVTLTSSAGSVSCSPLSTCLSANTSWPPSTVAAASAISITASYPFEITFLPTLGKVMTSSGSLVSSAQQQLLF